MPREFGELALAQGNGDRLEADYRPHPAPAVGNIVVFLEPA